MTAPQRQLPCGCWQALIKGDIVTSQTEQWVTILPCDEHDDHAHDSVEGAGAAVDGAERAATRPTSADRRRRKPLWCRLGLHRWCLGYDSYDGREVCMAACSECGRIERVFDRLRST